MSERPYEFVTTPEGPVLRVAARAGSRCWGRRCSTGGPGCSRPRSAGPRAGRADAARGVDHRRAGPPASPSTSASPTSWPRTCLANLRDLQRGPVLPAAVGAPGGHAADRLHPDGRQGDRALHTSTAAPGRAFLSVDHPDLVEESFRNYGLGADDVDLIVATDAEGILGIGDWGVGGIEIAIGKSAVCRRGRHPPPPVIPVVLDMGTDNLRLLNDQMYLGNRHAAGPRAALRRLHRHLRDHRDQAVPARPAALGGPGRGQRPAGPAATTSAAPSTTTCRAPPPPRSRRRSPRQGERDLHGRPAGGHPRRRHGRGIADMLREVMVREGLSPGRPPGRFWCLAARG